MLRLRISGLRPSDLFHLNDDDIPTHPLLTRNASPQRYANNNDIRRAAHNPYIDASDRSTATASGDSVDDSARQPRYRTESQRGGILGGAAEDGLGCVEQGDARARKHAKVKGMLRDAAAATQTRAGARTEHHAPPPGGLRYRARGDAREHLEHGHGVAQDGYERGQGVGEPALAQECVQEGLGFGVWVWSGVVRCAGETSELEAVRAAREELVFAGYGKGIVLQ